MGSVDCRAVLQIGQGARVFGVDADACDRRCQIGQSLERARAHTRVTRVSRIMPLDETPLFFVHFRPGGQNAKIATVTRFRRGLGMDLGTGVTRFLDPLQARQSA